MVTITILLLLIIPWTRRIILGVFFSILRALGLAFLVTRDSSGKGRGL
jgi:hypothetical protein